MSEKLTKEQRAKAEEAMADAILDPHGASFVELFHVANRSVGRPAEDADGPCYRLADRFLQKHRKAGNIEFRRFKSIPVWFATGAGVSRLAREGDHHD